MGKKQGKVWGITEKIFGRHNVEVHRIVAKVGGYCSKHHHVNKYNLFYVESGSLEITVYQNNGLEDKTILNDGDSFEVPPGVWHRFESLKDNTIAYEIYWSDLEPDDIVREDHGGVRS